MSKIPNSILKRLESGELIPAIAQDAVSKKVLMLAWMTQEALSLTLTSGFATYWSRSRNEIWKKGASSGNTQKVISISFDCDSDALLLTVEQLGPACHTGETTCFHNDIEIQ